MNVIEEFYEVEQGLMSPRDNGVIGWRAWAQYPGGPEGRRAALREAKKLGIARVLACKPIWITPGLGLKPREVAALEKST